MFVVNSPVTRRDVLVLVVVLAIIGGLKMFGNYEYDKGAREMAEYVAQQLQNKPSADSDPSWGGGSTK